jgi:large-conductance mechanosensitive channel
VNTTNKALGTGIALAVTVAIAYSTCALFFWLLPDAAMRVTNALFHGLDFRNLQSGSATFDFGEFIYALIVLVGWAFVLGTVFGWLRSFRDSTER